MSTVSNCWVEYASIMLPEEAPEIQRVETRRAFFAGCQAMLTMIALISDNDSITDDAGTDEIEKLAQELLAFGQAVSEGRA